MNYKKVYDDLVESRKFRGVIKRKGDGLNKHHILPKCLGGNDNKDNLVLLTFKEHIIAHHLLTFIYPDSNELLYAYLRMIQSSHSDRKENTYKLDENGNKIPYRVSLKSLEELREKSIDYLRKLNTNRKHSDETKKKLSESHKGKKASQETKELLSKIRKGHILNEESRKKLSNSRKGIIFSDEQKQKLSESRKNIKIKQSAIDKISGSNSITARQIIGPDGKEYGTMDECAKNNSVSRGTIYNWLKFHPEKGFKYKVDNFDVSNKIIGPDGTIYRSITNCAKLLHRSRHYVERLLSEEDSGYKLINKN